MKCTDSIINSNLLFMLMFAILLQLFKLSSFFFIVGWFCFCGFYFLWGGSVSVNFIFKGSKEISHHFHSSIQKYSHSNIHSNQSTNLHNYTLHTSHTTDANPTEKGVFLRWKSYKNLRNIFIVNSNFVFYIFFILWVQEQFIAPHSSVFKISSRFPPWFHQD
jgi:hypothetical protein